MIRLLGFCALALVGSSVSAATIVYNVDQAIGLGTVTGTVETDGTLGTLGQGNVSGFSLTVSALGASVLLNQGNSVIVTQGSNLIATATDLSFDYSGASGLLLFQFGNFGTGMKYFCNASVADTCFQGASAIPESFNSASAQVEARSGRQVIASVAGTVPEPASWALMISGFGLVGVSMRRRNVGLSAFNR